MKAVFGAWMSRASDNNVILGLIGLFYPYKIHEGGLWRVDVEDYSTISTRQSRAKKRRVGIPVV